MLRVVEDQYAGVIPAYVERRTAELRTRARAAAGQLDGLKSRSGRQAIDADTYAHIFEVEKRARRAQHELEETQAEAEAAGLISMTLTFPGNDTRFVAGTADQLTEHLRDRKPSVLKFEAPVGRLGVGEITLTAGYDGFLVNGLRLDVSSPDARWAATALAEVSDEIRLGVPWWRWLRAWWFLVPFYFACLIASASAISTPRTIGPAVSLTAVFGWAVAFLGAWAARRYVRPFELVSFGSKSRGARVLAAVGGGVASVALGILVNRIS